MIIDDKYLKVLSEIQIKANEKFNDKLFVEVDDEDNEKVAIVFDEMLKKDIPEWKRKYLEIMKKELLNKKQVVDERVGKLKDKWIDEQIKKAVKKGLLTNKIK